MAQQHTPTQTFDEHLWDFSPDIFTTRNRHFETITTIIFIVNAHGTSIKIYQAITLLICHCNAILNCQVDLNGYGIDWDGPLPSQEWDGQHQDDNRTVEVPCTLFPLSQHVLEHLQRTIDPLRNTQYHGVDIYMEVVCILEQYQNI